MSLSARLARMETSAASQRRHIQVSAADEADADRQILDAFLGPGSRPYRMTVTIGGQVVHDEMWGVLSHEECLELLEQARSNARLT